MKNYEVKLEINKTTLLFNDGKIGNDFSRIKSEYNALLAQKDNNSNANNSSVNNISVNNITNNSANNSTNNDKQ